MKYFPQITPKETIEKITDIIRDKVVCDIGCSEGDWMLEMSKYSKRVIGIDIDIEAIGVAAKKGLEVYLTDALFGGLPEADIYYMAMNHSAMIKIYTKRLALIPGKIVIIGMNNTENSFEKDVSGVGDIIEIGKFKNDAKDMIKNYQIQDNFIDFKILIIRT